MDRFESFEKAGWEQKASPYYVSCRPITDRLIEPLLDAAHVGPGSRVLDIGTGPGDVAGRAAERGATVVGLDFAEAMIAVASRAHPGLTFVVGDAQNPPFVDRSFDAIVGNFVLHHLSDRQRALASWRRLLRPGGWLALTVWDAPSANRLMGLFVDAVAETGVSQPADVPSGPPMASSDEAYHEALCAAGYDPTAVATIRFTLQLATTDALWSRMLASSVRTAALVAEQPPEVRQCVRAAFDRLAAGYMTSSGLAVPVSVKLLSGAMRALPKVAREHHERLIRQVDRMPGIGDAVGLASAAELADAVGEMLAFLQTVLLPHIEATESVLYPDLQLLVPCRDLLGSMRRQHTEIRELVREVERLHGRLHELSVEVGTKPAPSGVEPDGTDDSAVAATADRGPARPARGGRGPAPLPPADAVALRRVVFRLYAQLKIHLAEEQQCMFVLEHRVPPERADELAAAMSHPGSDVLPASLAGRSNRA